MASAASYDTAIIGGGACGLAVLLHLVERAPSGYRMIIFEKASATGPGLAYSAACAGTHINAAPSKMSIFPNDALHFSRWLKDNECTTKQKEFPSREHFGKYLTGLTLGAVKLAAERGIELVISTNEVLDLQKSGEEWTVKLANGSDFHSKTVALAVGNSIPTLYKQLQGKPMYFDRPWPNDRLLTVPKTASVCVLGSRLTGIDVAVYLTEHGHTGPITLLSLSGRLPKVQTASKKYERSYALHNLARELESTRHNGLLTIAKRIHDEIVSSTKENPLLPSPEDSDDTFTQFSNDLQRAKDGNVPGQDVLQATTPVVERYWHQISDGSKRAFLGEFMSEWSTHRHAIPMHTAEKLMRLMSSGQLHVRAAVRSDPVRWGEEENKFVVPTKYDGTLHFDAFVEATGIEYDANKFGTPLMNNLLASKVLKAHTAGGVEVDYETNAAAKGLYVLGAMTRGVHFYTASIDRNKVHAERITDVILGRPLRKSLHVALFVGSDVFSQLTMAQLVPRLITAGHMPYIYLTARKASRRGSQSFELREMAFYEHSLLQDHVIPAIGGESTTGQFLTAEQLRKRYGIFVKTVTNINSSDFVRGLAANYIDVGYNISCRHKFKPETISYFQARQGLWDLHPNTAPAERVASAVESMPYSLLRVEDMYKRSLLVGANGQPTLESAGEVWTLGANLVDDLTEKIARGYAPKVTPEVEQKMRPRTYSNEYDMRPLKKGVSLVDGADIKRTLLKSFAPMGSEDKLAAVIEDACTTWYRENSAPF